MNSQIPDLIRHFRTDCIKITCFADSVANLDGEALHTREIVFRTVPGKLRFVCPKGVSLLTPAAAR